MSLGLWALLAMGATDGGASAAPRPVITSIGPRLVSNQTSYPLAVLGQGLKTGMTLSAGGLKAELTALDERHAYARWPAGVTVAPDEFQRSIEVKLDGAPTGQSLNVVNDTAYPMLTGLVVNSRHGFVASTSEDAVYAVELQTGRASKWGVADGPTALAPYRGGVAVAHRYSAELRLLSADGGSQTVPGPLNAEAVLVVRNVAYVAEHARDTVSALDLAANGKELWRTPVAPNPGVLEMTPRGLAVGSLQTGEFELLEAATGKPLHSVEPGPGAKIFGPTTVGGNGPALSDFVMNGSRPRAAAFSARQQRLFVASIGPNTGPNPKKMEVAMNGGVSAMPLGKGKAEPLQFQHHLGFAAGVTQALAVDDSKGLLYAADVALGLVRVLSLAKLSSNTQGEVERAVLQEVALPPPADFPLIRPVADFAVKGRAGVSLHSGPSALALSEDKRTLHVLNRFTGTLASIDVRAAERGAAKVLGQVPIASMLAQASRRRGEVLYFADLGRTAVTCDSCHPEGHTGGVMFEKTDPLRIYRTTTVRGSLDTAPYFTPASTFSIGQTVKFVMERNRFGNPVPTPEELEDVARYVSTLPTLPNPWADASGAPPQTLVLPDGSASAPRRGLLLFEGKAGCVSCHPGPLFTTDQDPASRGQYLDVGTPPLMPLRTELQNPLFRGFGVPSLVGTWDVFPLFSTGLAGLKVDGARVRVETRFPLRRAVKDFAPKHGRADLLTAEELNDLLGYVQSL